MGNACYWKRQLNVSVINTDSLPNLHLDYFFFPLCKKDKLVCKDQSWSCVFLLGIASLLITDAVGHSLQQTSFNQTQSQCMFQFHKVNTTLLYPALNMHWSVLIPPNLLLGISPLLVITTTLEFIKYCHYEPEYSICYRIK